MQFLLTPEEYDALGKAKDATKYAEYLHKHYHEARAKWLDAVMKLGDKVGDRIAITKERLQEAERAFQKPMTFAEWRQHMGIIE